jgi:localization factor PodJL
MAVSAPPVAPAAPKVRPAASPAAGDSNTQPDAPIEPGAGPPRSRPGRSAAERIAASQAALGAMPADRAAPASRPNFIVAARRAAQAASEQHGQAAAAAAFAGDDAPGAVGKKLAKRVKSLFLSTSLVVIAVGVAAIALSSADLLPFSQQRTAARPTPVVITRAIPEKTLTDRPVSADMAATVRMLPDPFPAATPSADTVAAPRTDTPKLVTTPGSIEPAAIPQDAARSPDRTSSRMVSADVTGSIAPPHDGARIAVVPPAEKLAPGSGQPWSETLPAAVATKPLLAGVAARNPAAAYEIAIRFANGRGVPADLAAAATWFARAAEDGLAPAQFRLGSMYEKGLGVKKDLAEARRLYLAAAAAGNAEAMHNVAVLYAEGVDGKPDFGVAVEWFRKAAERGVTDSQYNLAILYARGVGVEQNFAEAYKWFSVVAQKGDRDAAKKRDDMAQWLDQQTLAAARVAASVFTPAPQPEEATTVQPPRGGWDDVSIAPAKPKSRASQPSQRAARL